jgi:hypothetical protein
MKSRSITLGLLAAFALVPCSLSLRQSPADPIIWYDCDTVVRDLEVPAGVYAGVSDAGDCTVEPDATNMQQQAWERLMDEIYSALLEVPGPAAYMACKWQDCTNEEPDCNRIGAVVASQLDITRDECVNGDNWEFSALFVADNEAGAMICQKCEEEE